MITTDEMVWHRDGHGIHLTIDRSNVVISSVDCPLHDDRACRVGKFDCIVTYFLENYGLDCNVGSCDCAEYLELAWTAIGDFSDSEQCQVWVIPTNDEAFAAWLVTQSEPQDD